MIRKTLKEDLKYLEKLYLEVSKNKLGIARYSEEINPAYIRNILEGIDQSGLGLVKIDNGEVIAAIHAFKYGIRIFDHILTDLTILVHPDYQSQGYGKEIFKEFLSEIENNRPDILRVELETRSNNEKSNRLYESLGFKKEGVMVNKARNYTGEFEDSLSYAWSNKNFKS